MSALQQGTTFSFSIPLTITPPQETLEPPEFHNLVGVHFLDQPPRILVAEDDPVNRAVLADTLHHFGLPVIIAENGIQAIEQWQHWHPDLILMDLQMPQLDGLAAARQIRLRANELHAPPQPLILAVTASVFTEDQAMLLEAGCDGFISKPVSFSHLFQQLETYLPIRLEWQDSPQLPLAVDVAVPLQDLSPADLPQAVQVQLQNLALMADDSALRQLAHDLQPTHPKIAQALVQVADQFNFHLLLDWIASHNSGLEEL